jgi:hypothetical protein
MCNKIELNAARACSKCGSACTGAFWAHETNGTQVCGNCSEEMPWEVIDAEYYETGGCADCDRSYGPGSECRCSEDKA